MRLFILPPCPLVIFLFSTVAHNGARTQRPLLFLLTFEDKHVSRY